MASMFDLSAREQTALRGLTQAHRKGSATAFSVDALQRRLGTAFATEGARYVAPLTLAPPVYEP